MLARLTGGTSPAHVASCYTVSSMRSSFEESDAADVDGLGDVKRDRHARR